jgi:hypothetical protein
VALSKLGVDLAAAMVCGSLLPARYRGATRIACTESSRKGAGDKANDVRTGCPLAAKRHHWP